MAADDRAAAVPAAGDDGARSLTEPLELKDVILRECLGVGFSDPKTKLAPEALRLVSVLTRCFASEALHRSAQEASSTCDPEVGAQALEKILPQLLLDF